MDKPKGGIDKIFESLYQAIRERDLRVLREAFYTLENVCRRNIFGVNKEVLKELYDKLNVFMLESRAIIVRSNAIGESEWPEACMMMGGIQVFRDLIGELILTETHQEIIDKVMRSKIEKEIITILAQKDEFILSGELANLVGKRQNSVTNRLYELESRGLILRAKRGKNSFIYLTEKGKSIGKTLIEKEESNVPPKVPTVVVLYKNLDGEPVDRDEYAFAGRG
ncbi:MAG: hypothetical protein HQK95_03805 [Nitrospirae bacterium]|nr:hypothetical protein [Nitrospirota bacterium]